MGDSAYGARRYFRPCVDCYALAKMHEEAESGGNCAVCWCERREIAYEG